jgi:uncharacterized alpha/beta hydrolase family protein/uncharacterized protein YukE
MKWKASSSSLRRMAAQFQQTAEQVRRQSMQIKAVREGLSSGKDGWAGAGAQAFFMQTEIVVREMQRASDAFRRTAMVLQMLASWNDELKQLRKQIDHLDDRILDIARRGRANMHLVNNYDDSELARLRSERERLQWQLNDCERRYDSEGERRFSEIARMAPRIGELLQQMRAAAESIYGPFLQGTPAPLLVRARPGDRTGREKVDYLNDVIRMNQMVRDYYKKHPNAKGPNGESAEMMVKMAHRLMEDARRQGGTVGVPIVFMHGLEGGLGTFQKMVDALGGNSGVYTYKDGKVKFQEGKNTSADRPVIQYVFEDGAMSFKEQSKAFAKMTEELKKRYDTEYIMVVSHSMGGVITTKYIEDTGGHDVTKLVTLGSPILGSKVDAVAHGVISAIPVLYALERVVDYFKPAFEDLNYGSAAIRDIYKNRGKFNPGTEVFSAAGTGAGWLGDGVVTVDSAFGLRDFAAPGKWTGKIYKDSGHSALHDNPEEIVDSLNFILYGEKPENHVKVTK